MTFFRFVIPAYLSCVLFVGFTEKKLSLTIYGKEIKCLLPEKTYSSMFAVNTENDDQLLKAVNVSTDRFKQIIGTPIDHVANSNQTIYDLVKLLGKSRIDSALLFYVFTFATQMTFKDEGVLNEHNVIENAEKYVCEINQTVAQLDNNNILTTLPALFGAHARLLKSAGVSSSNAVVQFARNIIHALHKF